MERDHLERSLGETEIDFILFVTSRAYRDNYFYHGTDEAWVLSMGSWEHYTSLPEENGVLFFIAQCIADRLLEGLNHYQETGCLSDHLGLKTGVDRCMRLGHLCESCSTKVNKAIANDAEKQTIFGDLTHILDLVANTSRWGKSVFYGLEDKTIHEMNPSTFEDFVADYYRSLGADVKQDISIAGFQVDVLATETTASGERIRSAVECKFYKDKVGNRIVNDFARLVATMREAGEVERGTLIAYSGFSKDAQLAAKHSGVKLLHYKDILQTTPDFTRSELIVKSYGASGTDSEESLPASSGGGVFVIMPFSSDLDDVYYYGIHGAVLKSGGICNRADQVEFTGNILQEVYKSIRSARLIVAEVSGPNPNVFYELGYAHALEKQVILVTRDISAAPFDLAGFNHIVYSSIQDLEEKLAKRLQALMT
jgi:hypothetical protein